jgi:hypothetical protein
LLSALAGCKTPVLIRTPFLMPKLDESVGIFAK